mmetsp:Transcript_906/g.1124  ORF Transcript_906/g.1124 Transcript_906/m.1124 type:complete len:437 (+) Transcript_906:218-1528(+)
MVHPCDHCGSTEATKRCSRCHSVWYCGIKCQKEAWRAGHRLTCGKMTEESNSMINIPEQEISENPIDPPMPQPRSTGAIQSSNGQIEVDLSSPTEEGEGQISEEYEAMAREMGKSVRSGQMLLHSGRFREAARAFEQGEALSCQLLHHLPDKQVGLNLARVEALRGKGCAFLQLSTQQANKFLNQSLSLINQLKIMNNLTESQYEKLTLSEADCYDNLGTQKLIEDNAVAALCLFNQSLAIMKRIGNTEGQLVSYGNIGLALQQLNRLDEALEMQKREADLARKAYEETGEAVFNSYVASALNNSGSIYLGKGDRDAALACFKEACQLSHETQNLACKRDALVNLINHTDDVSQSREYVPDLTELQNQCAGRPPQTDCTICLENLAVDTSKRIYVVPQCEHLFHQDCWDSLKTLTGASQSGPIPCPLCHDSMTGPP